MHTSGRSFESKPCCFDGLVLLFPHTQPLISSETWNMLTAKVLTESNCEARLRRLLLWDTNYHAVRLLSTGELFLRVSFLTIQFVTCSLFISAPQQHHCYPMVPFYNLGKLHELMRGHIINNELGHFTLQNFRSSSSWWLDRSTGNEHESPPEPYFWAFW
jgi:hypothetical protein